ncbi:HDOD domain-containing protein [Vibrio genomosp. F10]|uniref:Histidine kinase n=2 Tax=Vibrio genomosp. F10 TaxID=723171 RepID=A0A1B9R321_9VIBR|nr:HDOD domain-containing protein [Vibrio genomosp. F10]OCH78601.1 histidine kinase [Vibrio genomosp. F10]OEE37181.1 histidine kinase [Vibrio genomosp. F10 str. ZF-129]OEE96980.1 histidine kinase [Vibrio genomosp. F10 str. 9ZC157]OEF07078.1 histidine kinase [Vibrio genomosp. F10 str. 9ZB36]OEF23711.1 histidine kinase [Vibrio genomosp. F10 str. 9ZD137]
MSQHALISRINELPRIESVLQELLDMVNRETIDFGELSRKMSMDQVLSARVLRMANSAHFGGVKGVSTINDAIVRVGAGAIRTLISSSILSSTFPKLETLNLKDYWANTFEVSIIASTIAKTVKLDANETFTTGVLHNIGELMIHSLVPEQAIEITARVESGESIVKVQQEVLGTDSQQLGAELAKAWQFPSEMIDAIANVNQPGKAVESKKLACVLYLARDIHFKWDSMLGADEKQTYLTHHPVAKALSIDSSMIDKVDAVRGQGSEMAYQMF